MFENNQLKVMGMIKILDADTDEVIVDTHNDVLYGNMSSALAYALIGNPNSFLYYLAFGNGGAYIGPTGSISYKPSLGGQGSLVKNPIADLYNTVYVKKLSNNATSPQTYSILSRAYIPSNNDATNYEDIVVEVTLGYDEPNFNAGIQQSLIDNSNFVGTSVSVPAVDFQSNMLVFNEIGLFAGSSNVFSTDSTRNAQEVEFFRTTTPNFSEGSVSKIMLTHAIFHPVQKAANRSLKIIYTLRIQMGAQ